MSGTNRPPFFAELNKIVDDANLDQYSAFIRLGEGLWFCEWCRVEFVYDETQVGDGHVHTLAGLSQMAEQGVEIVDGNVRQVHA